MYGSVLDIKRRLCDRVMSAIVRARDNYTCQRCRHVHDPKSKGLHTSHYFNRRRESTRFDLRNLDSLCLACHILWSHGDRRGEYMIFKMEQLGKTEYKALHDKAKIPPYEDGRRLDYIKRHDLELLPWLRFVLLLAESGVWVKETFIA